MLFLPIYVLLTSFSMLATLTSNLLPFGLQLSQRTFTLSLTLSNGHLSLDFHHEDVIEAYMAHNNLVQYSLTTIATIS